MVGLELGEGNARWVVSTVSEKVSFSNSVYVVFLFLRIFCVLIKFRVLQHLAELTTNPTVLPPLLVERLLL